MNPDAPLRTKNLAEEDPAPMDDTLGGYAWLPRMIDKARASRADCLGSYFRYPCPIDTHCLSRLGLTADSFATLAVAARTGRDVLTAMATAGASEPRTAWFDPVDLNRRLHSPES